MSRTHYFAIAYRNVNGSPCLFECEYLSKKALVEEIEYWGNTVAKVWTAEQFETALEDWTNYDADTEEAYDYIQSHGAARML